MTQSKEIYVYMDWQESDSPIQMGVLHSEVLRGKEVFSFENNTDWLTYKQFRALDPDLVGTYVDAQTRSNQCSFRKQTEPP